VSSIVSECDFSPNAAAPKGLGAEAFEGNLEVSLRPVRDAIDRIDSRLMELLNERAALAIEAGRIKARFDAPVFRPERERQVIARLQRENAEPLRRDQIAAVSREIMGVSRALEGRLRAAYLGPPGTYSEQAMLRHFGQGTEGLACRSLDHVFQAVERGDAQYGVVPVENSTAGMVARTLDLLLDSSMTICAEALLPIRHRLLTSSGTLAGVTRVSSHPQALAQCEGWLSREAPWLERLAVASSAEAARLAVADATMAAIAGDAAQERYGLKVAVAEIQDEPQNRTRFLVIGGEARAATGNDQTSLWIAAEGANAVHRLLEPLARHAVQVRRLESRPAPRRPWDYYFFVDVDGHCRDAALAAALAELRGIAQFLKPAGSYPRAS
jgi:chorismate mutase/prephenate dehydratase